MKTYAQTIEGMCDADACEAFEEYLDLKEHAQDFVDTYTNSEIAQMVREGVLSITEVEDGLRRRMNE